MYNKNEACLDSLRVAWSVGFFNTNSLFKFALLSSMFLFSFSPWMVVHADSEEVSVISKSDFSQLKTDSNPATVAIEKGVKQGKDLQVDLESARAMSQVKLDVVGTLNTANQEGAAVMVSLNDVAIGIGTDTALPVMASLKVDQLSDGIGRQGTNSSKDEKFLYDTVRDKVDSLPFAIVLVILALVCLVPVARRNE